MWLLLGRVSAVTSVGGIVHALSVREIVTFFILAIHRSGILLMIFIMYLSSTRLYACMDIHVHVVTIINYGFDSNSSSVLLHIDQSSTALNPSLIES